MRTYMARYRPLHADFANAHNRCDLPDPVAPWNTTVLLQCLLGGFGSVFPQCGLMVFPGAVIVSR